MTGAIAGKMNAVNYFPAIGKRLIMFIEFPASKDSDTRAFLRRPASAGVF
jgi:hypothetical protein